MWIKSGMVGQQWYPLTAIQKPSFKFTWQAIRSKSRCPWLVIARPLKQRNIFIVKIACKFIQSFDLFKPYSKKNSCSNQNYFQGYKVKKPLQWSFNYHSGGADVIRDNKGITGTRLICMYMYNGCSSNSTRKISYLLHINDGNVVTSVGQENEDEREGPTNCGCSISTELSDNCPIEQSDTKLTIDSLKVPITLK